MITDQQVKLMKKIMSKTGGIQKAAAKADVCRQTASKYLNQEKLPSELKPPRSWKTHADAFAEVWNDIEDWLISDSEIEARTIFEDLQDNYPGKFADGQLRTLYRRINDWRALHDDDANYEVFFPQAHRPGEAAQTDFTHIAELLIIINGELFSQMLCHFILPYSNWELASCCQSESFLVSGLTINGTVKRFFAHKQRHETPWRRRCRIAIALDHSCWHKGSYVVSSSFVIRHSSLQECEKLFSQMSFCISNT